MLYKRCLNNVIWIIFFPQVKYWDKDELILCVLNLKIILSVFFAKLKYELVMSTHQKLKTRVENKILLEKNVLIWFHLPVKNLCYPNGSRTSHFKPLLIPLSITHIFLTFVQCRIPSGSPKEKQSGNCLWEKYLFFSAVDNLAQSY